MDSRTLGVAAVAAQRIESIEQSAERIVHLMRHAGGQPAEHRIFLLLGETRRERLPLVEGSGHRIEPIEQLAKFGGDPRSASLRDWLGAPLSNALYVARQDAQRLAACA